jgi:Ran GTPase-activating protein (RanGAP) involved in mRNA processing and transport
MPIDQQLLNEISSNKYIGESLTLVGKGLGPKDAELLSIALRQNIHIKKVDLRYNEIGDEGAKFLAPLPLVALHLVENNIGLKGAQALSGSSIKILNLAANAKIGFEGAKCFERALYLEELLLDECHIGDIGVKAVLKNPNLKIVSLSTNDITDAGLDEIPKDSKIKTLILEQNQIMKEGAEHIARLGLTVLNLASNGIGDRGAAAFANHDTLEVLDLSMNGIGKPGFLSLFESRKTKKLILLDNKIAFDNVKDSLPNPQSSSLTHLNLGYNQISDSAAGVLKSLLSIPNLQDLNLRHNKLGIKSAQMFFSHKVSSKSSIKVDLGDNPIKANRTKESRPSQ